MGCGWNWRITLLVTLHLILSYLQASTPSNPIESLNCFHFLFLFPFLLLSNMRIQSSSIFHLSSFPSSRHVCLRCRPVFTPNSQHRHYLSTRLSHNRIENSPISADEPIPTPSKSKSKPLVVVTNKRCGNWGHVRILALNSPKNRNAISWQLLNELRHEIDLVRAQRTKWRPFEFTPSSPEDEIGDRQHGPDGSGKRIKKPNEIKERNRAENPYPKRPLGPTRAIIIASELDMFCAGADLKQRAEMSIEE